MPLVTEHKPDNLITAAQIQLMKWRGLNPVVFRPGQIVTTTGREVLAKTVAVVFGRERGK